MEKVVQIEEKPDKNVRRNVVAFYFRFIQIIVIAK